MNPSSRRTFLKVLGAAGAASLSNANLIRAFADNAQTSDEFFIFVHCLGGWDVTLCTDPRWETKGLVNPASTANTDVSAIRGWVNDTTQLDDGGYSFQPVRPAGTPFVFGPTLGKMVDHASRMTLVNGLAMNTVSHFDGQIFVTTGRHLSGGRPNQPSIDVAMGNELGTQQLMPIVSVQYPSYIIGPQVDPRATPLRISAIGTVAKSLSRSTAYETQADRDRVTAMLGDEAKDLADLANDPRPLQSFQLQYEALRSMIAKNVQSDFGAASLMTKHPEFAYKTLKFQSASAVNAAFAIEAFKQNIARCVSFLFNGFDTHFTNYRNQALTQQEAFDTLATLIEQLDVTPHPTKAGAMLSDHTHILVTSDFCRTPQINLSRGRDHYPNGSAIVISPRFKGGTVYGKTDDDQLLPAVAGTFSDGARPVSPPDVLATMLGAFQIDSQKYFREGEVVKDLLVTK